jgi:hypothetical protein
VFYSSHAAAHQPEPSGISVTTPRCCEAKGRLLRGTHGTLLVSSLMLANDYFGSHNLVVGVENKGNLTPAMLTDPL